MGLEDVLKKAGIPTGSGEKAKYVPKGTTVSNSGGGGTKRKTVAEAKGDPLDSSDVVTGTSVNPLDTYKNLKPGDTGYVPLGDTGISLSFVVMDDGNIKWHDEAGNQWMQTLPQVAENTDELGDITYTVTKPETITYIGTSVPSDQANYDSGMTAYQKAQNELALKQYLEDQRQYNDTTAYNRSQDAADRAYQQQQLALQKQAQEQNNYNATTQSIMDELDKLETLKKTPRSWIEYTQKGYNLNQNPTWNNLLKAEQTAPSTNTAANAALKSAIDARLAELGLTNITQALPNTPDWLAKNAEVPAQAGQPLSTAIWKMPSQNTWNNTWTPTGQEMFKGVSDWRQTDWNDTWALLKKLWYSGDVAPKAQYNAAFQR